MTEHEEIALLRHELTAARIENARFRRMAEDLLYNLDGENMPTVDGRIKTLEEALTLIYTGEGLDAGLLHRALTDAFGIILSAGCLSIPSGEEEGAHLSATEFRLPYVYKNPASKLDGLRPLYMDAEGRITALGG